MKTVNHSVVTVVGHGVALKALTQLRDAKTGTAEFRRQSAILAVPLLMAATHDLPTKRDQVLTPLGPAAGHYDDPYARVVIVPVLRAGLALSTVLEQLIPEACTHHLGIARDEATALPKPYYPKERRPIGPRDYVVLVDPMLATGGSAIDALNQIKAAGGRSIRMACVVAAQEGIDAVLNAHPDVEIYTVAIDAELNAHKYIVPGLGDFGDRYFGTCPKR
jgi:uracil phosphoribosyltransferase